MADHTDWETRWAIDPDAAALMGTDELRENFLIEGLFAPGRVTLCYSHYDRMIVGSAVPGAAPLALEAIKPTGTKAFLDRRELVAVNIGGQGRSPQAATPSLSAHATWSMPAWAAP